eukprot:snap_masked-scaffold_31-processed-gene-0.24-mRNA-1 protein AED:1.00 eAED:1.00 QI:0/0/0/0/1/1/2/0/376
MKVKDKNYKVVGCLVPFFFFIALIFYITYSENSFYKHLVVQENLEAKVPEELLEQSFDPNDPKLEAVAERLISRWENSAEKPECMHLSVKQASKAAGIPQVLSKRIFRDDVRFVFAVGLEGMGHHFIGPMFKSSNNTECPPKPVKADKKASTLAHHRMQKGLFGSNVTKEEQTERLIRYMEMALSVANKTSDNNRRSVIINTMCNMEVGMLSYPNDWFTNVCHRTDFTDVRVLAEMFEAIHLDFRVVFINALDILLSTAIRRKFGHWEELEEIYEHVAEKYLIQQQLNRLDPRFYKCFDYDKLPALPENFGDFFNLNPEGGGDVFQVENYKVSVDDDSRKGLRRTFSKKDTKGLYKNLQKSIDKIEQICYDAGTRY